MGKLTFRTLMLITSNGIVAAILKMSTDRHFSMSGINSGHHNLPTYQMTLKSDNVEFVRYYAGHFENGPQSRTNSTLLDFKGSF
jgi:hypothetical protein